MKRDPVAAALKALAEAATRRHDPTTVALARDSLRHRSNHVVARAARAAREAGLTMLAPELIAAFPRFLDDPIRCDPGCVAKTEIARALLSFDHAAPDVFLRGVLHVQREPAFGPPIDTAAELRALSAMALVATEHPAALDALIDLITHASASDSKAAVEALRVYAHDEPLQHRVDAALEERRPIALRQLRRRRR